MPDDKIWLGFKFFFISITHPLLSQMIEDNLVSLACFHIEQGIKKQRKILINEIKLSKISVSKINKLCSLIQVSLIQSYDQYFSNTYKQICA